VPDVVSEREATASEKITAAGFVPKFNFPQERAADPVKKNIWVKSQSPVGGPTAPLGTVVTLTMEATIVR
jgi:beta-lactam-binding protein with PASTA domain